jgi:hypothetical protein
MLGAGERRPVLQRAGFGFDRGFQGVRWIRGQTSDGFVVDPTPPVTLDGPPEKWRGRGAPSTPPR